MARGRGKSRSHLSRRRRFTTPVPASRRLTAYNYLPSLPSPIKFRPVVKSLLLEAPPLRSVRPTGYRSVLPQFVRDVRQAYTCARRKIRREVLFAVAPGGRGGSPRRKRYSSKPPSNVRC